MRRSCRYWSNLWWEQWSIQTSRLRKEQYYLHLCLFPRFRCLYRRRRIKKIKNNVLLGSLSLDLQLVQIETSFWPSFWCGTDLCNVVLFMSLFWQWRMLFFVTMMLTMSISDQACEDVNKCVGTFSLSPADFMWVQWVSQENCGTWVKLQITPVAALM